MKNLVIAFLLVSTIVVGYIAATSSLRLGIKGLAGETESITRGDLTLPITATGEVMPARRVEVKSKASGEVIEILKFAGDRVSRGDLLIRLLPDEEERIVARAKQDMEIAAARLATMELNLRQAQTADLESTLARVAQLKESVRFAKFRKEKLNELDPNQTNEEELLQRETSYKSQLAELRAAQANVEKARIAIPRAKEDIRQAKANHGSADANLADAEKRLRETNITSPIDGVVADIRTQIGEVIQGGKTTFTGGTVLAIIIDDSRLLVRAEVDESDIGRVLEIAPAWARPGNAQGLRMPEDFKEAMAAVEHPPSITVESFRDIEFSGIVERIYPEPKTLSGVVTYLTDVVIVSENRDMLLPGMRADVTFTSQFAENVLLCPNEAIREGTGGKLGVYVPAAKSTSSQRRTEFIVCRFGLDNGNFSEVREGLTEGAIVYTKLPAKQRDDK